MKFLIALTGVTAALLMAPAVSAQTPRPERPYRGLFASGTGDTQQNLSLSGSLSGGYHNNIFADATGRNFDTQLRRGGFVTQGTGSVNYSLGLSRLSINASAGSSVRYYPEVRRDIVRMNNASLSASVRLLNRPATTAIQSVSYQPVSFSALFPVLALTPAGNEIIPELEFIALPIHEHYLAYSGGVSSSGRISRRTTASANYSYRVTEGLVLEDRFLTQSVGAGLSADLTAGLSLRVGYAYSEGRYGFGVGSAQGHRLDAGVNYRRALSFSRRTTLSFGTGSTGAVHAGQTRFRASGRANLDHEIGRTWTASIGYNRGLQFVETLREPVFSDAVTATLSGLFSRRVEFQTSVRSAIGEVGSTGDNGFKSHRASASLTIAATRYLNFGVDYAFYRNNFGDDVMLPLSVASHIDRQSIRAAINVWAPLFSQRSR